MIFKYPIFFVKSVIFLFACFSSASKLKISLYLIQISEGLVEIELILPCRLNHFLHTYYTLLAHFFSLFLFFLFIIHLKERDF